MGNRLNKLKNCCFSGCLTAGDRRESAVVTSEPYNEDLVHSFRYVWPKSSIFHSNPSNPCHPKETTIFRSISGAAISANTATPLSTSIDINSDSSVSLQQVPVFSGPLSGPLADGFLSGPIERHRCMSGPLDGASSSRSGPLRRSLSHSLALRRRAAATLLRSLTTVISRSISSPVKELSPLDQLSSFVGGGDSECCRWAQGRAGEDRVHVVISEEHGWLFVGIYDGFNGPDATDYLLSNLYSAIELELKGIISIDDKKQTLDVSLDDQSVGNSKNHSFTNEMTGLVSPEENIGKGCRKRRSCGPARKCEDNQRKWKYEWFRERLELDRSVRERQLIRSSSREAENHSKVLEALSMALKKTEEAFLETADMIVSENPELALMGSCVLVMVMKGEDVYLMNVGDSRAVLGKKVEPDVWDSVRNERLNLESINEETLNDLESYECGDDQRESLQNLVSLQLTKDHSTSVEEEVRRIRNEHPEDSSAIANDRVKGSLKVTRAFGAGFLKQPKWNNAILEMFRIDYIGTSPYITCNPFLSHHRLNSNDKFIILSSDGLYQYFTNEEAVTEVESFISTNPEGDPAQHLIIEVLFRAAKNAGMNFYELLEIPQGDRRRYHDDVSIIIISFEGRIWRSCM